MKTFLVWLSAFVITLGVFCFGANMWYSGHASKILILVDSSYSMELEKSDIQNEIQKILRKRYSEFSVGTFDAALNDFSPRPAISAIEFYGPRPTEQQLNFIKEENAFHEADYIYILTNWKDISRFKLSSKVEIIRLKPYAE